MNIFGRKSRSRVDSLKAGKWDKGEKQDIGSDESGYRRETRWTECYYLLVVWIVTAEPGKDGGRAQC